MNRDILAKTKPKRKSQKQQVLEHLQSGKTLTQAEAIKLCGSYRLGAIVHVLRGEGYDIVTIPEKNKGHGLHARYEYKGEVA